MFLLSSLLKPTAEPPSTSPDQPSQEEGRPPAATGLIRFLPDVARMGVLAALYFAAATLGLSLAVVHNNVSLVWPPTGIALAALLLFGYRLWPGVALGAFLINASTDVTLATAAGIGAGNTLEALTGAYLLQRVARFRNSLDRLQDVLALVALAGGLSTTVSATIGVASLCLGGSAPWALYGSLWWQWWLGDAMGALVFAPVLLTWGTEPQVRWEPWRVAEAGGLLALLAAVSQSVFVGRLAVDAPTYPLAFAIFPFVIWAALRFGPRGAATGTLVVSAIAIWGTWEDLGPFLGTTLTESLLLLQTFMGVIAVTGLLLAAAIIQRERAEQQLRSTKDELLQLELYQRQRTEQVLLESEARKGAILESALDCIITIDHAGKIIDFNPAAEKTFGFTRTQVWGKEMAELIIPPSLREKHRRGLAHYLATGEGPVLGKLLEMSAVRADGTEFPVELAITRIRLGGPPMFTGYLRDITERKRAEATLQGLYAELRQAALQLEARVEDRTRELHVANAKLQEATHRAEEASRYKSDFLANMSHELRTPLNSIIGFSELLQTQTYGALNEKQTRHVNNILASGRHLLTLINDILDLSKVEAGRLELHLEPFGLPEMLRAALADIRPQADAKDVQLHLELADALPRLTADPVRFKQILYNLLSNAVKFTLAGGRVTVAARSHGEGVELRVADTGIGIAAEDLPKLFRVFTQLEAPSAKRHQGTGLGLALTKKFVELHGGTIEVSSDGPGQGTTFIIRLPMAPPGETRD